MDIVNNIAQSTTFSTLGYGEQHMILQVKVATKFELHRIEVGV